MILSKILQEIGSNKADDSFFQLLINFFINRNDAFLPRLRKAFIIRTVFVKTLEWFRY